MFREISDESTYKNVERPCPALSAHRVAYVEPVDSRPDPNTRSWAADPTCMLRMAKRNYKLYLFFFDKVAIKFDLVPTQW